MENGLTQTTLDRKKKHKEETQRRNMNTENEIALYDKVEAIAARYETQKRLILNAIEATEAAEIKLKEDYLTQHKRNTWQEILDKSTALEWMSTKQTNTVRKALWDEPKTLPEVTVESLRSWLQDLVVSSPDMIQELCREAFEMLTPQIRHSDHYKTNETKREIPKTGKVILTWMCEYNKQWDSVPKIQYNADSKLMVLDRVFALLAGMKKPEGEDTTYQKCRKASEAGEVCVSTFWGELKMHKNGNMHVTLTKPDLVKKLIAAAAGKTLTTKERAA